MFKSEALTLSLEPFPTQGKEQLLPYLGQSVLLGIRPEAFRLEESPKDPSLVAMLDLIEPSGAHTMLHLQLGGYPLMAEADTQNLPSFKQGALIRLAFSLNSLYLFSAQNKEAILHGPAFFPNKL